MDIHLLLGIVHFYIYSFKKPSAVSSSENHGFSFDKEMTCYGKGKSDFGTDCASNVTAKIKRSFGHAPTGEDKRSEDTHGREMGFGSAARLRM
jgi:hypothetical protein